MKIILVFTITLFSLLGNAATPVDIGDLKQLGRELAPSKIIFIKHEIVHATEPEEETRYNKIIGRGYTIIQDSGENFYIEYSKGNTFELMESTLLKIINEICFLNSTHLQPHGMSYCQVKY
ncbi:MAG: hypothetical protein HOO06_13230 [Bdellovibrionaceae bacterium]|jgi:hypothetical protein|nr:hypothetical protein [Pseudobdellovibrionaceae bacterium]